MFRIGEFSKFSRISVRMLHHYDELSLLKPTHVDALTGYRYYSASQLPRLNRILALKDLGLSLEQIARLLDQNLSPEQIRGMFKLKQTELQQQLAEGQMRLIRVENWLNLLEMEATMPEYDVILTPPEANSYIFVGANSDETPSYGIRLEFRQRRQWQLNQIAHLPQS